MAPSSKRFGGVIPEARLRGNPAAPACPDELTEAKLEPASLRSPQRMGVFKQYMLDNCVKDEAATLPACAAVGSPLGIFLCFIGQRGWIKWRAVRYKQCW